MQGLQERVSDQRRHGPAQGGVLASVLSKARPTLAQPGIRPCGGAGRDRVAALAPVSSWLARSGPSRWLNEKLLGIDRRRLPPGFARRSLVQRFSSLPGMINPKRRAGCCCSPIRSLIISSPRLARRRSNCSSERVAGHARSARPTLLRPTVDLQRLARSGRCQRPAQCRASARMVAPGWTDHRLRAELHPDDSRRLPRAAQGRAARPGRDGCEGLPDFRGVLRLSSEAGESRSGRWKRRVPTGSWSSRIVTSDLWSVLGQC